jgi:putative RecB family exonuclease
MIARINNHHPAVSPPPSPPDEPVKAKPAGPMDYLSASRLKCWQECRLKFLFRYVERIPVPTVPNLFAGSVVHAVLQAWNLARWRGGDTSPAAMRLAFDRDWVNRSADDKPVWEDTTEEAAVMAEAWTTVTHWLENPTVPLDVRPEGVEVSITTDLSDQGFPPLFGVIDLVLPRGRVIDFKTAGRKPEPAMALHQHQTQLACYALLYRDATGAMESSLELHHLIKTKTPATMIAASGPAGEAQMAKLHVAMRGYVDGIGRKDWTASPGQHCAWCDYRAECGKWKGGG